MNRMRRLAVLLLALLAWTLPVRADSGDVREGLTLPSQVMKKTMRYSIYLPPGYETTRRTYPVLYLLHGYSDDDSAWIHFGDLPAIMDEALSRRDVAPMIVVMPDGGTSWYVDNFDSSVKWEEYFIKEFLPYIESRFRVHPTRSSRAIAGLSMGGFGALVQTLHHPELFGSCAALSGAVYTDSAIQAFSDEDWTRIRAVVWGPGLKGSTRLTTHMAANNPIKLVASSDPEKLKSVRWYLDCGDEDSMLAGNLALHQAFSDRGVRHALRVRGGAHTWAYWRSALPATLSFVTASFRQN